MSVKTQTIKKTTLRKKGSNNTSFVRITIDPKLQEAIDLIQQEFSLLSTAEAVKLILSKGLSNSKVSLSSILNKLKLTNPVKTDLTEDEMFAEWEKFDQD
jgi:hypothetical protein